MPATLTIPSVFTAIDRFSAPMKRMAGSIAAFAARSQRALNWANAGFAKLVSPITSLNKMLMGFGYYVGLYSLIRVLQNAIKTFAEFEQAQVDLSVVLQDNSLPLMNKLTNQARTLALTYGELAPNILKVQTALAKMGFGGEQIFNMTPAIIAGARAFQASPERVSEVAAGILLSYEKDSSQTKDVINKLAYAANLTAADFESFATQLPIVNRVAKLSGQSYEQVLAYLGTLRNVQIHTATGATSLKNILIDAGKRGMDFDTAIKKVANSNNAVIYAYNKFGKRSVVSAVEFAHQLGSIKTLVEKIKNAPENYIEELARKQLQTFNGSVKLMRSAWNEFILSIEDGKGPIAGALKNIIQTGTAMLYMMSNTVASREQLMRMNNDITDAARKYLVWLKVIGYVVAALIAFKVLLIAWSIVMGTVTAAITAYNIAAGIMAAVTGATSVSISSGTAYLIAYRIALAATTATQWLFSQAIAATSALPFIGAIGLMVIAVEKLDQTLFKALQRWNDLNKASEFQKRGVDFKQMQNEGFWEKLYKFPQRLLSPNHDIYSEEKENNQPIINPKATEQDNLARIIQQGSIGVDFSNVPIGTKITSTTPNIMPKVHSTNDAQFLMP